MAYQKQKAEMPEIIQEVTSTQLSASVESN